MASTTHIFVSHSHEDNAWCRDFVTELRAKGADVWYDEHDMGYGSLSEGIERELRMCPIFIVILSPTSIASRWVQREVDAAIHLQDLSPAERIILPVVARTCDVPLLWVAYKRVSGPGDTGLMPAEAAGRAAHFLGVAPPPATVTPTPTIAPPIVAPPVVAPEVAPPRATPSKPPQSEQRKPPKPKRQPIHAITDLYDEERRQIVDVYPSWLVIASVCIGCVVLLLTGFLGYTKEAPDSAFIQPWGLFLWLCALLIALQVSILRDQSLRSRLIATLVITVFAIFIIFVTNFGNSVPDITRQLFSAGRFLKLIGGSTFTYATINFGILAYFWIGAIRRLLVYMQIGPIEVGNSDNQAVKRNTSSVLTIFSIDLLAGAALALVLSFFFRADLLNFVIHPNGFAITGCTVSWLIGSCTLPGGGIANPPSLTFIDVILTLIFLFASLLPLFFTGIGALANRDARTAVAPQPTARIIENVLLPLRFVTIPLFMILAIYGFAQVSVSVEAYLHGSKEVAYFIPYALPALGWGIVAVLCGIFSVALLITRGRVIGNSLRFVGALGLYILPRIWIIGLALWAVNELFLQTNLTVRRPFDPPSWPVAISLVYFLGLLIYRLVRRPRGDAGDKLTADVG